MNTDKTLYYTDGHQVVVTDSFFKVKKTQYYLHGITKHGLSVIHPSRIPYTLLLVLGTFAFICGAMDWLPSELVEEIDFMGYQVLLNSVIMVLGVLSFLSGSVILWMVKDKYAVRIATAEGEKDVVVSESKEYISQIVDALNRAFMDVVKPGSKHTTRLAR